MNRLTGRDNTGNAYFTKCFEEPCNGAGATEWCDECDGLEQVCERLAAYEDTGLNPEQLIEIDRLYRELCEKVKGNDLAIVESLPSLYPLQDFEAETIRRVVMCRHGDAWIPVSICLPRPRDFRNDEKPKYYLVQRANGRMEVAEYLTIYDDGWFSHSIKVENVIAWQPLPEPYKSEEK